jgi:hypothetical protein
MVSRPSVAVDNPACPVPRLAVAASSTWEERLGNAIPLALSLLLISFIFWGPFKAPLLFAVLSTAFFFYWLLRSYSVAIACAIGLRRIARWKQTDWHAAYRDRVAREGQPDRWEWPRHLVIIPNYRESEEGLARTIDSLAAQSIARQLVVVLAMPTSLPPSTPPASPAKRPAKARTKPGPPGKPTSASSNGAATTSVATPSPAATPTPSSTLPISQPSTTSS